VRHAGALWLRGLAARPSAHPLRPSFACSPPPLAAARQPAWVGISGGGEAAKELLDIMSNAGSGEPVGLPCSPPLRAANPLPSELCRRFAELQAGGGPARTVGDAKIKVVGFQTPARFGTSL